eukprot:358521-Chlamydomonas_euryale.AAC.10
MLKGSGMMVTFVSCNDGASSLPSAILNPQEPARCGRSTRRTTGHSSQATVHRPQFAVRNSQSAIHMSQFTRHNAQFTSHMSQFTVLTLDSVHRSQVTSNDHAAVPPSI